MSKRVRLLALISSFGLFCLLLAPFCWALPLEEEVVKTVYLPERYPTFPAPGDEDNRYYLREENVSQLQDLLLAPLARWLKNGVFAAEVVRSLAFTWEYSDEWQGGSRSKVSKAKLNDSEELEFASSASSESDPKYNYKLYSSPGFPFGDAEKINEEDDVVRKAKKILWNVSYATNLAKDVVYGAEVFWFGAKSLLRKSQAVVVKAPFGRSVANIEPACPEGQGACLAATAPVVQEKPEFFSREVFRLFSPPAVFGYAIWSWRYFNEAEDRVWLHSPVIGQTRKLLSSNMGDPVLGSLFAYDDLWVWSGKVSNVIAKVVEEKTLFVPYPSLRLIELEKVSISSSAYAPSSGGETVEAAAAPVTEDVFSVHTLFERSDGSTAMMAWNSESHRYPQAAPWVPTGAYFIPRKVWILETSPNDPSSLTGREVLVVEQESMLPVYKIVYDQRGEYVRTVIGGWGLSSTADRKNSRGGAEAAPTRAPNSQERFPFLSFVLVASDNNQPAVGLSTNSVKVLTEENSKHKALLSTWFKEPAKQVP